MKLFLALKVPTFDPMRQIIEIATMVNSPSIVKQPMSCTAPMTASRDPRTGLAPDWRTWPGCTTEGQSCDQLTNS